MPGPTIRRAAAKTATRALQLASLALVAGAVAAATMPGRPPAADPPPPPGNGLDEPPPELTQGPPPDFDVIAANLETWDKPPEAQPPAGGDDPGLGTEITPPEPPSNLRFLGVIKEPRRRLAVLAIDAVQKIIAEGDEFEGHKVIEVGDTWARVSVHGVERRVEKARTTPMLSSLSSSPMGQPVGAGYMDPGIQAGLSEQDEIARKYAQEGIARAVPMTTADPSMGTTTTMPPGTGSAKAMEAMRRRAERMRAVPVPAGAAGNANAAGDFDSAADGATSGAAGQGGAAGGGASGGPVSGGAAAGGG